MRRGLGRREEIGLWGELQFMLESDDVEADVVAWQASAPARVVGSLPHHHLAVRVAVLLLRHRDRVPLLPQRRVFARMKAKAHQQANRRPKLPNREALSFCLRPGIRKELDSSVSAYRLVVF